jgi:hypothetical protein
MHCCKKSLSTWLLAALMVWLFSATAHAEGIFVNKAEIRSSEEGYQLSATYNINLNFVVKQALMRGIPIYFVGEFSLGLAGLRATGFVAQPAEYLFGRVAAGPLVLAG